MRQLNISFNQTHPVNHSAYEIQWETYTTLITYLKFNNTRNTTACLDYKLITSIGLLDIPFITLTA